METTNSSLMKPLHDAIARHDFHLRLEAKAPKTRVPKTDGWGTHKVPLISFCRIISVECPTNLNFPLLTTNQNTGRSKQPISVKNLLGILLKLFGKAKLKGL